MVHPARLLASRTPTGAAPLVARFCALLVAFLLGGVGAPEAWAQSEPALEVWHGLEQRVGHLGHAQSDFNVLGNVADPDGVAALTYRLNGGPPQPLTVRPSFEEEDDRNATRRLANPGDFNADIPLDSLQRGLNTVRLVARDELGNETSVTVAVTKQTGYSELPYGIDWSAVEDPQDVGQYVDGHWGLEEEGLRVRQMGYDRIFLIGEAAWQDYEVTVPVTVNDLDTLKGGYQNGVGLIMRFTGHIVGGHRNFPDAQPKHGYLPLGGIGWLRWKAQAEGPPKRQLFRGDNDQTVNFGTTPIEVGVTYVMKMRAETLPDASDGAGRTRYSWKMWREGADEPAYPTEAEGRNGAGWTFVQTSEHALRRGSLGLLAHYADATFGDVLVTSLDETMPAISGAEAEPGETTATITWTTDEPSFTQLAYGTSEAHRTVIEDRTTKTEHRVELGGLLEGTTYHYRITSTDPSGNATTTEDATFKTGGQNTLPVELVQFEARIDEGAAHLTWRTASETSNMGFEVQHRLAEAEGFARVGFVEGAGTTSEPQRYRHRVADLGPGRHTFRLKQIDYDGAAQYSDEVALEVGLPTRYHLSEAYPNPFNPQTQLDLHVREAQRVRAEVYDMTGRRVAVLYDGMAQPGAPQRLTFRAGALASGSYVLRVEGEAFVATRRMVLLK